VLVQLKFVADIAQVNVAQERLAFAFKRLSLSVALYISV
jgi:hypothetical protein